MRPIFAMLATSLAFATPALATSPPPLPKETPRSEPLFGYVTFNGLDGASRMTLITIGDSWGGGGSYGTAVPYTNSVIFHPGKPPLIHKGVIETGTRLWFRAHEDHQGVIKLDVNISTNTLRDIKKGRVPGTDKTIDLPETDPQMLTETISISDDETVPLISSAGKPLGTLTWAAAPLTATATAH